MNKLREAALAALKELNYIEQTEDISTGSHIDVAQKLHAALAEREEGMTLRDYFAVAVLPTIITYANCGSYETAAKTAYMAADAMLKARGEE